MSLPIAIFDLGPAEMMIVGVVAVLLFGERLPEVGRTFGKKFVEFKKGLQSIEGELHSITRDISSSVSTPTSSSNGSKPAAVRRDELKDYAEATAPKFEPPPAAPPVSAAEGESAGG